MSPKFRALILILGLALFSACSKQPSSVEIDIIDLEFSNEAIEFEVVIDILPSGTSLEDKGFMWGTDSDLEANGTEVSHGYYGGGYYAEITDVLYSTQYYIQAYVDIDGTRYTSNKESIYIDAGWGPTNFTANTDINDIAISPSGVVHAIGDNSTHFYSSDKGGTWSTITHSGSDYLRDMVFIDQNVAFMIASNVIRKSTDGGMNWIDISVPTTNIQTQYFYDEDTYFYSFDDTVYSTVDGGANWSSSGIPQTIGGEDPRSIHFLTSTIGYVLTYGGDVAKSTDGGLTWSITTSSGLLGIGKKLWIHDENNGIAAAGAYLYSTSDGGSNWDYKYGGTSDYIQEMDFYDNLVGVASAGDRGIVRTVDGGQTWVLEYDEDLYSTVLDVELFNATLGYAVDDDGVILKYE